MSKLSFIFDMETIGQSVFDAPIVNCAYMIFDWHRFYGDDPYTFKELIHSIKVDKFDVKAQIKQGRKYTKKDIQWWEELPEEARRQLNPSDDDILLDTFVENLYTYLKPTNIKSWWSRSNAFDPVLLQRAFLEFSTNDKLNEVLPFWRLRDVRTYIDTRFEFKNKKNAFCPIDDQELWDKHFIQHNPVHDLAADILRIQKIERILSDA